MFYLLISGRQHQVIIPIPHGHSIYTSWDWNLAEMHVLFIDIWKTGSGYNSNATVFILVGIVNILPKCMFHFILISGRQD
jgi:hypothetical protein